MKNSSSRKSRFRKKKMVALSSSVIKLHNTASDKFGECVLRWFCELVCLIYTVLRCGMSNDVCVGVAAPLPRPLTRISSLPVH